MNIQASHNEGVTQTLGEVRATLAEVTVIQSEERDCRLNERFVFALCQFYLNFNVPYVCISKMVC
jgi:hypothetical protein